MNQWILPTVIVLLVLLVGAFTLVSAHQGDAVNERAPVSSGSSVDCGSSSCDGGCTAESNCGVPTCGATNGGDCGCRR